jgi:hypothetical protein
MLQMEFPLPRSLFCLTVEHNIDDTDAIERYLAEYPEDTEYCLPIALRDLLSSPELANFTGRPLTISRPDNLLQYLEILWSDKSDWDKLQDVLDRNLDYLALYLIGRLGKMKGSKTMEQWLTDPRNNAVNIYETLTRNAKNYYNIRMRYVIQYPKPGTIGVYIGQDTVDANWITTVFSRLSARIDDPIKKLLVAKLLRRMRLLYQHGSIPFKTTPLLPWNKDLDHVDSYYLDDMIHLLKYNIKYAADCRCLYKEKHRNYAISEPPTEADILIRY